MCSILNSYKNITVTFTQHKLNHQENKCETSNSTSNFKCYKQGCVDGTEVRRGRCLISGLSRAIPCWVIRQFIGFCTPSSTQFSPFAFRICLLTFSVLVRTFNFFNHAQALQGLKQYPLALKVLVNPLMQGKINNNNEMLDNFLRKLYQNRHYVLVTVTKNVDFVNLT